MITEQGYQIAETTRNPGINENMPGRWKREITEGEDSLSSDGTKAMRAELTHLKKENKRLKMESEIFKKAAAFFAKESGQGIDSLILRRRRIR